MDKDHQDKDQEVQCGECVKQKHMQNLQQKQQRNNDQIPFAENNYTHNIRKGNERMLDRRSFMKTMVGAAGAFAVSTLPWGALAVKGLADGGHADDPPLRITDIADLPVGEAAKFAYPGKHDSALLIRLGENEYKAYQNACTHLKCPVFWSKEKDELICPCHHGVFDVRTGKPTAGPPQRPLPEVLLRREGGAVYATGVKHYET